MSQHVVEQVKRDLEAAGEDLRGPCGAFKITNLVAQRLGLGLMAKASGENCRGFKTDAVMTRPGVGFDVLGDAGGLNTPMWGQMDGEPQPTWYRDPVDTPDDPPVDPPVDPPGPNAASFESDVRVSLGRVEVEQGEAKVRQGEMAEQLDALQHPEPVDPGTPADYETTLPYGLGKVTSKPKP